MLKARLWAGWLAPHLAIQHVQPVVGDFGHAGVHLLQSGAFEERLEDGGLENFDELQLSPSLHLESARGRVTLRQTRDSQRHRVSII